METFFKGLLGEKYFKLFYQLFKFGLVGIVNTALDYGVFNLFFLVVFRGQDSLWPIAFCIGYTCGLICSYTLNKLWTFKEKSRSAKQIILFIAVNLAALSFGLLEMKLITGYGIGESIAKLLSIPGTLFINFVGNKLFVFKN